MQFKPTIFERIILTLPWVFIGWYFYKGLIGDFDGLLVFVSLFVLVPLAAMINVASIAGIRGRSFFKQLKNMQQNAKKSSEPLNSTNYADLPWYDPKRWKK